MYPLSGVAVMVTSLPCSAFVTSAPPTIDFAVPFPSSVSLILCFVGCGCGGCCPCLKCALTSTSSSGIINVVVVEFALSGSTFTPVLVVTCHPTNLYSPLGVAFNVILVPAISSFMSPTTPSTVASAVPCSLSYSTSILYNFPKVAFIFTSSAGIINAVFSAPSSK